jgi:hypothetical protein
VCGTGFRSLLDRFDADMITTIRADLLRRLTDRGPAHRGRRLTDRHRHPQMTAG